MSIINWILRLFVKPERKIIIGKYKRNDLCYCGSGLKFKKCHALILYKKGQTAYRVVDKETKEVSVKIYKTKNNSIRIKSNLTWDNIGGGGIGSIDP